MRRKVKGSSLILVGGDGHYTTEDGEYEVSLDHNSITYCEDEHPMKLPRAQWRNDFDAQGRYRLIKGYQCPGNEEHAVPLWNAFHVPTGKNVVDDFFDTFTEAAQALAGYLEKLNSG